MGANVDSTVGARLGTKTSVKKWNSHKLYRWRVSYVEGGKYRQKGFKTQKAADEWAENKEKDAAAFGNETSLTIAERSTVIDTREKLGSLGLSIQEALAFAIDYHEKAAKSATVEDFIADFIDTRTKAGLSDGHLNHLEVRLDRFKERHGDVSMANIEKKQIEDWLHRLAKDFHPRTVNHHRVAVVTLFNEAIASGYIEKNPAEMVKPMKVVESETEILTLSELTDLLEVADERILPAFAIGAFAGIRDSEIKKLDWSDINFKTKAIRIRGINAKSAKSRHVPILDNLQKWIEPLAKPSGPVWPANGRKLHDQAKLAVGFANPARLTKKQREERDDWRKWPSNGLRHSYASYHLVCFEDAAALALNMGHMDTSMIFSNYRALVTSEDAEHYWTISPDRPVNVVSMAG